MATEDPAAARDARTTARTVTRLQGSGDVRFSVLADILQTPLYWDLGPCSGVAVDDQDRLWVASRRSHPISIWSSDGAFLGSWVDGDFVEVHHIAAIDGAIWVVDDQLHVVRRYEPDGRLVLQLGKTGISTATVSHTGQNGGPFNMPTGLAVGSGGELFVSDGYGNRQVHRFSSSGALERSWGRSGIGPGEFAIVHSVTIDGTDRVIICDRENNRVQLFDYDGSFVAEWTHLLGPADAAVDRAGLVYVVEQGNPLGKQPNGVTVLTMAGEIVGRWHAERAGAMGGGHGIALDSKGNVYVADLLGKRVVKLVRES